MTKNLLRTNMKFFYILILATCTLFSSALQDDITKQTIVKIYTTSKIPNYLSPWSSSIEQSTGSGAIIEGGYILTNAHVVANQTFIEVQRYGQRKHYVATVFAVSHQADLALLKVDNNEFFEGVTPLKFGALPEVEQKIVVYGYPMGGSTLSATIGVVSRIEHHAYAHSGESFLAIQVDAAVNPGNSGGPALSDGKIVGVVMQVISKSQNIGYLVPVRMVQHFIKDMQDGKYDGFADLGINMQKLENPTLRRYCGIDDNVTGNLIDKIVHGSTVKGVVKEGDILITVDGHKVEDDGTVAFREHEYTNLYYFIDQHQVNDRVKLGVISGKKYKEVDALLKNTSDDMFLVKTTRYDTLPSYFIYGGYVFSPLTRNLIRSTGRNRLELNYLSTRWQTKDKKEVVVLLKVLASDLTRGNNSFGMWPIEKINGEIFSDFQSFYKKMQESTEKYIILEDADGVKVIIDKDKAQANQKTILKKYNIEFDKSIDLRDE